MAQETESGTQEAGRIGWKWTFVICCGILTAGAGLLVLVFATEPAAVRTDATRQSAMLVETVIPERGTFRPVITAMGTVVPAREVILRPRVSGQIIERVPAFTPGGVVRDGQTLVRIDPADYKNALAQRKSDLRQAVADLHIEMGRQNVAQREYALLEDSLSEENRALVLREPQLNAARAQVEAARAAVAQAELDLARTSVKAPFDAQVLARDVDMGSQVAAGDRLGRLVGVDTYWVEASVPLSRLRWLSFSEDGDDKGSMVQIRNRSAWPEGTHRRGSLYRLVGALDERTRMARVLVAVSDPLARDATAADMPALMVGEFVEARIKGAEISDVIRLDRKYVRRDGTVWVADGGRLDIREVAIVYQDDRYAYIRSGLDASDRVVTTNLTTVVDGARLRIQEAE